VAIASWEGMGTMNRKRESKTKRRQGAQHRDLYTRYVNETSVNARNGPIPSCGENRRFRKGREGGGKNAELTGGGQAGIFSGERQRILKKRRGGEGEKSVVRGKENFSADGRDGR